MDRVRRGELPWTILDDLHRASLARLVAGIGHRGPDRGRPGPPQPRLAPAASVARFGRPG